MNQIYYASISEGSCARLREDTPCRNSRVHVASLEWTSKHPLLDVGRIYYVLIALVFVRISEHARNASAPRGNKSSIRASVYDRSHACEYVACCAATSSSFKDQNTV